MKKIILMFVALLGSVMINAQNYTGSSKFTDNVSVTLQGGVLTTLNDFYTDHTMMAPIAVVGIDKYINPWLGVGIEGRTLIGTGKINEARFNSKTMFDAVNVSSYVKINVLNAINYTGERKFFEPVVYTGLGWGHQTATAYNYMTYRAGTELNFNLGKERAWAIVVNPSVVWGPTNDMSLNKHNGNFEVTAGIVYHFKTSNKTHTMKVIDIKSLQSELNTLRAHECPKPITTTKAISTNVVTKEVIKYVNKSYIVTFAKNSSELNLRAKNDLNMIPTNVTVNIEASASPEGSVDHNLKLSQDRANSVKEYLESRGIQVRNADGVGVYDNASGRQAIITIL